MTRLGFALGLLVLLLAAESPTVASGGLFDKKLSKDKQAVHVLNRLTFGPRPGDPADVRRAGVERWIRQQLHPETIPESPVLAGRLEGFETLQLATWQILEKYQQAGRIFVTPTPPAPNVVPPVRQPQPVPPPQPVPQVLPVGAQALQQLVQQVQVQAGPRPVPLAQLLTEEQRRTAQQGTPQEKRDLLLSFDRDKRLQILRQLPPAAVADIPELRRESLAARQPQQFVNQELIENRVFRALYSNRQLEEVLVDFWLNHFNVFNGKGPARMLLTSYERDGIRPHVLGRFRDMLLATARHPAMLHYLDNWQSQSPRDDVAGPREANVRRPGLNENYGRELLELHTLGVNGGYTQDDVIAVARAFTGWTIYDLNRIAEYQFNPANHDRKEKVVLGHTIPAGGGEQDGLTVIDTLARHPSTARFISRKLAQRFVADAPPEALIDTMAATFTRTDGDLRAVLETMFTSREFLSEGAWQAKLKSPFELVVSAARAVDADVTDAGSLAQRIADLGQPLYGKVEPTGYSDAIGAWANSAGFLGRINFASALVNGQVPGARVHPNRLPRTARAAADQLLGAPSRATRDALEQGLAEHTGKDPAPATLAAVVIASPDFQRR